MNGARDAEWKVKLFELTTAALTGDGDAHDPVCIAAVRKSLPDSLLERLDKSDDEDRREDARSGGFIGTNWHARSWDGVARARNLAAARRIIHGKAIAGSLPDALVEYLGSAAGSSYRDNAGIWLADERSTATDASQVDIDPDLDYVVGCIICRDFKEFDRDHAHDARRRLSPNLLTRIDAADIYLHDMQGFVYPDPHLRVAVRELLVDSGWWGKNRDRVCSHFRKVEELRKASAPQPLSITGGRFDALPKEKRAAILAAVESMTVAAEAVEAVPPGSSRKRLDVAFESIASKVVTTWKAMLQRAARVKRELVQPVTRGRVSYEIERTGAAGRPRLDTAHLIAVRDGLVPASKEERRHAYKLLKKRDYRAADASNG